ncbi:hypothetical protein HPB50_023581 [Hyalomma asiaticum]|uniref:Uncharacterized protein n=1 Tax=Hyalomma asiaticum TaxID=266040 RepID=A0ACB7T4H7_HYAAI|nr:hypothetical protein HPB50_023581 [Hyalomma asiaticum]
MSSEMASSNSSLTGGATQTTHRQITQPIRKDMVDIKEWANSIVEWAAKSPGEFIYYVLLCLSPFFLISAFLSWKLAKHIEAEEKRKKQRSKKKANVAETRRAKAD